MEREASSMLSISIMMLALAALIGIVWYTVYIGNVAKGDAYTAGVKFRNSVAASQLSSIMYKEDIVVPKAAAFNLITQENEHISSLIYVESTGNTTTTWTVSFGKDCWEAKSGSKVKKYAYLQDILSEKLGGKVEMYVEPYNSTYVITITDIKQ